MTEARLKNGAKAGTPGERGADFTPKPESDTSADLEGSQIPPQTR